MIILISNMVKKRYILIAFLALAAFAGACKKPNELPPLNKGYATYFILPEPTDLTVEDREYIEKVEKEYEEAIKK